MNPARWFLLLALLVSPLATLAQESAKATRPITIDDHLQIRAVEGPSLSPDAKWVAYSVTTTSLKQDDDEQRIWMVPFAGGDAIPLTAEGVSSGHPRWSPDGKYLAFLSARHDGKTQVWLLNRQGGEAERLTETPQAVDDFAWSPDSKQLCLTLRDVTKNWKPLKTRKKRKKAKTSPQKKKKRSPKPKNPG
jgi:dipeptidyl aminopeptidase/acylaminoacyl peptidase